MEEAKFKRMTFLLRKYKARKLTKEEDEELDRLSIEFMENERIKSILHRIKPTYDDPFDKNYINYELSMSRTNNTKLSSF